MALRCLALLSIGVAVYAVVGYALWPAGALVHPDMRPSFEAHALAFAAVTLRVYVGLGMAAGGSFDVIYPWIAWLCWLPNIAVAERLLRRST